MEKVIEYAGIHASLPLLQRAYPTRLKCLSNMRQGNPSGAIEMPQMQKPCTEKLQGVPKLRTEPGDYMPVL